MLTDAPRGLDVNVSLYFRFRARKYVQVFLFIREVYFSEHDV
jgi:hypothetical protein